MATPPPIELDILGWSDSLILMVLALVVFGPRRLPQIGRQIGKLMYEFRKASNEFKFQMEEELRSAEEADRRKKEEERLKALALKAPAAEVPATPAIESAGSPYSEDAVYPPVAPAAESELPTPADSQPAAPAEPRAEETYPRILPPATGEQVPAARSTAIAELQFDSESAIRNGSRTASEPGMESDLIAAEVSLTQHEAVPAQPEESHAVTEQAAQHG